MANSVSSYSSQYLLATNSAERVLASLIGLTECIQWFWQCRDEAKSCCVNGVNCHKMSVILFHRTPNYTVIKEADSGGPHGRSALLLLPLAFDDIREAFDRSRPAIELGSQESRRSSSDLGKDFPSLPIASGPRRGYDREERIVGLIIGERFVGVYSTLASSCFRVGFPLKEGGISARKEREKERKRKKREREKGNLGSIFCEDHYQIIHNYANSNMVLNVFWSVFLELKRCRARAYRRGSTCEGEYIVSFAALNTPKDWLKEGSDGLYAENSSSINSWMESNWARRFIERDLT
ncbi:hypothetical protein SISNIDRAFT_527796 [Sistotremastrum niveocremeum HHB9708]|uniref:Uncharacterized protein n=1 Tax=Sistotremastrum niveocremeum HHB9708 TaxID=1314777 RepID=A0A164PV78_9AGAM|nr:hypothetical protein SISNIDRAFT_527796 [Sistotremastrum niveocremeum HHB9708]